MKTKKTLRVAVALLLATFTAGTAWGQGYPNHSIRFISPFEPGGGTDLIARYMAQRLSVELNQSVVVENRPGAGGAIGAQSVAIALGDGYTIMLASRAPIIIAPLLNPQLKYDPLHDLAPITQFVDVPSILVVPQSSPIHTFAEFLADAKASPDKLSVGSSGVGGSAHLAAALLQIMAGIKLLHVPYKGTGPALVAVMSGQVSMTFGDVVATLPFIKRGQLRAVALSTPERIPALPDLAPIADTLPGYNGGTWYGVVAPGSTPKPIIAKLNDAFVKILHEPAAREWLTGQNLTVVGSSPADFAKFLRHDTEVWTKVVREAHITAQ